MEIKYIKGADPDEKLLEKHYSCAGLGVDILYFGLRFIKMFVRPMILC